MNYSALYYDDAVNGTGYRTSLFVSGCDKSPHCKECFNQVAWDFDCGKPFTDETKQEILDSLAKPHIKGLSILGGDPISNVIRQGKEGNHILIDLVQSVKYYYPEKTIFVWTGFKYEDIIHNHWVKVFLCYVDMLRDGEFIPELKDVTQYLEGSSNQRYIDVQQSLLQDKVVDDYFREE